MVHFITILSREFRMNPDVPLFFSNFQCNDIFSSHGNTYFRRYIKGCLELLQEIWSIFVVYIDTFYFPKNFFTISMNRTSNPFKETAFMFRLINLQFYLIFIFIKLKKSIT